ncbi:MmcQ/YjbR family DNA-binding protein [Kineococcus sp. SYSU DK005]|uniref:MmcQ/YjbR family DNA-binding protein n=1 Tax=Kineococcus sp. SYSU DK005 TaxID=3383126 RepID=UPI003D7CFB04
MSLSGSQLQQVARETAQALADVSNGRPFTAHLEVWKAGGKVFLIVTDDDPDAQIITVKADPHRADGLRREHDSITRGRYLDKQHWISVGAGRGVTRQLVKELVQDSYDLVTDRLPKRSA